MNQVSLIGAIILGVNGVGLLTGCKSEAEKTRDKEKAERPAKFAAARAEFSRKPGKTGLVQQPYLKGKVVALSAFNGGEFGYMGVPELAALEAGKPEDVQTIVQQDCRAVQKGVYRLKDDPSKELPAYIAVCQITLIDRASSTAYYVKRFESELSKEVRVSKSAASVSSMPTQAINAFLKALPRN